MKALVLFIAIFSTSIFANCGSKIRSRVYRELQRSGQQVSISNIQVTHKDTMRIDQGALIKEMDAYEIEVLGAAMDKFTGVTTETASGCRVENIQKIQQLRI